MRENSFRTSEVIFHEKAMLSYDKGRFGQSQIIKVRVP